MANGINEVCSIKNRFQEPQAGWNFILPDGAGVPMIIDSGATFSFLSRGAWQKTRKLMKPVDFNIQKSTQVRNTILGYVEDITFKHPPDTIHFDKLLVVEGEEVGLYLNFLTLNQLGAIIDFNTGVLDINLQKATNQSQMAISSVSEVQSPEMPLTPVATMYGSQSQQAYQENNIVIEEKQDKADTRVLIPVPKDVPRKRSRSRRERSRERRNKSDGLLDNSSKSNICFRCRKPGHEIRNCPNNKEILKVETRFMGGNSDQAKHERNPLLIPVKTNMGSGVNRSPNPQKLQQQNKNNKRDSKNNSRSQNANRRETNRNDLGLSNMNYSNKNLVQIPHMNTLEANQNSQFSVYSSPNYSLMNPGFMQNQVPLQNRMSNFGSPMFSSGYNRFM